MKMHFNIAAFKLLCLMLFAISINHSIVCQDSLTNYLSIGARNNPGIRAKYNEYLTSLEMVPQAGAIPDPEVTFGYFLKPYEQMMGNQVADIRVMQMFPWFGTKSAAKNEAIEMAKARFQEFLDARNQLFLNIITQYYQLYLLQKEKILTDQNLSFIQSFGQLSVIRFQSGNTNQPAGNTQNSPLSGSSSNSVASSSANMSTSTNMNQGQSNMSSNNQGQSMNVMPQNKGLADVLNVQIEILDLKEQSESQQEKLERMKIQFNNLLNISSHSEVYLPDSVDEPAIIPDTTSISDSVAENNPMIKMYSFEKNSYQYEIYKNRRMGYPMFGIGLDYMLINKLPGESFSGNGEDMYMPMLTLTIPVYRKKYKSMQREALYKSSEAVEKQKEISNSLNSQLQNALFDMHEAQRNLDQYNRKKRLISESFAIQLTAYEHGETDFEQVVKTKQRLLQNDFKITESIVKLKIAIATLDYLVSSMNIEYAYPEIKN